MHKEGLSVIMHLPACPLARTPLYQLMVLHSLMLRWLQMIAGYTNKQQTWKTVFVIKVWNCISAAVRIRGLSLSRAHLQWQQRWYLRASVLSLSKPLWSRAAKRQLWLRRRAGPTAQMTQCLWLLLYSNVRVEATAKQHIFYFFEKRPCVCCSKFLIHCHCPTQYVGSYFPLACELYRNTAPDAGKVQRAESFSETTETRRERLPFRATRLRDWLKEYKNSS